MLTLKKRLATSLAAMFVVNSQVYGSADSLLMNSKPTQSFGYEVSSGKKVFMTDKTLEVEQYLSETGKKGWSEKFKSLFTSSKKNPSNQKMLLSNALTLWKSQVVQNEISKLVEQASARNEILSKLDDLWANCLILAPSPANDTNPGEYEKVMKETPAETVVRLCRNAWANQLTATTQPSNVINPGSKDGIDTQDGKKETAEMNNIPTPVRETNQNQTNGKSTSQIRIPSEKSGFASLASSANCCSDSIVPLKAQVSPTKAKANLGLNAPGHGMSTKVDPSKKSEGNGTGALVPTLAIAALGVKGVKSSTNQKQVPVNLKTKGVRG